MTEADILAMTYGDTCTVYRARKERLPSGESVFRKGTQGDRVYEAIPCALSSPSGGKLRQSPGTAAVDTDFLLFVRPEVDIQPGDTLVVTRLGKETTALAGLAQRHVSHNCIPIKLEQETV